MTECPACGMVGVAHYRPMIEGYEAYYECRPTINAKEARRQYKEHLIAIGEK